MVRNPTMEPTFYEEQSIYGVARMSTANAKRGSLTLDLNAGGRLAGAGGPQSKRPRLGPLAPTGITPLLSSPDLLKLGSPEFEKLLSSHQQDAGSMITTMPTPTSQMYFGEKGVVTEEQEQYARGFVDALNELHHSDSSQEPGSMHYTNLEPPGSVQSTTTEASLLGPAFVSVKDEPQTVPSVSSSPPMSPIDMENQEKIKLERKRQRNRVAASKCRRRKLERISRLEDKVKLLKGENTDLSAVVNRLREHVSKLKEQVIDHMHSGCQIQAVPGIF